MAAGVGFRPSPGLFGRVSRGDGKELFLLEVGVRWLPETFIEWKLKALAERGFRVVVASSNVFQPDGVLPGVELMRVPGRPSSRAAAVRRIASLGPRLAARSPRRMLRLIRASRRRARVAGERYGGTLGLIARCLPLAHLRPDVVHFEWHSSAVDHLPLFDVWDCPVTTSARGSDLNVYPFIPGTEAYASGLPEVLERVSAVHCVSASTARDAVALGLDPSKVVVTRPALDPDLFSPGAGSGREELGVVMVGWLRWEKGYEYALEAVRRLLDDGVPVRLEIVGDVPPERRGSRDERARILEAMADLGIEDRVHLHGAASSDGVARHLRSADVMLHASLTEGLPTAVVEAMATCLPVVATDVGGVREAVDDGVEGLVVPPRDPGALAGALVRLHRDPALRRRMGQAGRSRVHTGFTFEDEHGAFERMYREVVGT